MIHSRSVLATLSLLVAVAMGGGNGLACGFEDSKSASVARGVLNWAFPEALHVTTAVWQAQAQGIIGRDETPAALKALVGYRKVTDLLGEVRNHLAASIDDDLAPGISVVLLGPMFWSHFESKYGGVELAVHTTGPMAGDVVIVTDEPVITALIEGRLSPRQALNQGLMRIYGPQQAASKVVRWLDRWSHPVSR